jgi:hypothetical protein
MTIDGNRQIDYAWYPSAPTTPAGTLTTAPLVTPVNLGDVMLDHVDIMWPPGPSGAVGFQLQLSGGVLLPYNATPAGAASYVFKASDWLIADDTRMWFDLGIEVDSHLSIVTYNLGSHNHTVWFRFKTYMVPLVAPNPVSITPIALVAS